MTDKPEIDPYAPPRAAIADPTAGDYRDFARISTWWVLVLSFITLGLYAPYWLYTRIKTLNGMVSSRPIPLSLPIAVCVLCAANVASGLLAGIYPDATGVKVLSTVVQWASIIANLVCVFTLRNRLNADAGAQRDSPYWVGGVATFFFQVLYLNYKLNQRIDAEHTADASSTAGARFAHGRT
jgi:hypothetical protein